MKKGQNNGILKGVVISAILLLISYFVLFYILLTPLSIYSGKMWFSVIWSVSLVLSVFKFTNAENDDIRVVKFSGICLFVILICVLTIFKFASGAMFQASSLSNILQVEEKDETAFQTDIVESDGTGSIALMDTSSASMLGDREIGSLSNVVSQYNVDDEYVQINLNNTPVKVSALGYADIFKWINNKEKGVPGYIIVDPVSMNAEYKELSKPMYYVPSAFWGQDASRYIYKNYRTELLGYPHFEIDESGNPYYVTPVYERKAGLFNGLDVKFVIVLDPCSGELVEYNVNEVPDWVDVVYEGDLLCKQYNWFGKLKNGFWNSIFGKKGCKVVTSYRSSEENDENSNDLEPENDYGYIAIDNDIWIFTGVTSVNRDSSNIGFLLANQRTKEARYYPISGADEASAMSAAEGEVQEKEYEASFPTLINVNGIPTYIMVLKDASGIVKMYAAVNIKQYNNVVTATTQEACIEKYIDLMEADPDNESENPEEGEDISFVVAEIKYLDINGNTFVYFITEDKKYYKIKASDDESVVLIKNGDTVNANVIGKNINSIN